MTPTPEPAARPRGIGPLGWLRWMWRQLTSMRTALLLLLLLAVAALPGSTFPQRGIDAVRTAQWIQERPTIGPILDRLGFFEVYSSPWFAAIYLLLLVSLIGCVLPRTKTQWAAIRSLPPRAPKYPERLRAHLVETVDGTPDEVLEKWRARLAGRRYRVHAHDPTSVSAEKGYLKETGNLLFHYALVGIIVGVGLGHVFGFKGDVILPEGKTFANTLSRYDTFSPGPRVDAADLAPFTLTLNRLDAVFAEDPDGAAPLGTPRDFTAYVDFVSQPGASPQATTIKVNKPLETGAGTVFLLGNGYAPTVTVRDAQDTVLYSDTVPFLAQDNTYKSVGAIKVPGASPQQLGFAGIFLPTAAVAEDGPISIFPQPLEPALVLTVFEGNLFPGGLPQSVYTLDTREMTQLTTEAGDPLRLWITPGQRIELPDGRGSISFDGVQRFAGFSIRTDPGKSLTLGSAILALLGLVAVLGVRRRRVFVRVQEAEPGPQGRARTLVRVGGLAKDDDDGMGDELAELREKDRS